MAHKGEVCQRRAAASSGAEPDLARSHSAPTFFRSNGSKTEAKLLDF